MGLFTILLFLGAFFLVNGQDPTTVCYPPIFQASYFNIETNDFGIIAVDFNKQKFAEISSVTGSRNVHDFTNLTSYAITGSGNSTLCKSYKLPQSQVMYRCLPPYAKPISYGAGFFHYASGIKLQIATWDIETENDSVYRVSFAVANGHYYWPVLSQVYGYHGTTDVYMYLNPAPAVSNQSVFNIPADCDVRQVNTHPIV